MRISQNEKEVHVGDATQTVRKEPHQRYHRSMRSIVRWDMYYSPSGLARATGHFKHGNERRSDEGS